MTTKAWSQLPWPHCNKTMQYILSLQVLKVNANKILTNLFQFNSLCELFSKCQMRLKCRYHNKYTSELEFISEIPCQLTQNSTLAFITFSTCLPSTYLTAVSFYSWETLVKTHSQPYCKATRPHSTLYISGFMYEQA